KALVARHPHVQEVAAALIHLPGGEEHLVVYVVPKAGVMPAEKELRELLKRKVDDLAQPSQIVVVASLPKDAKGDVVPELLPQPSPASKSVPDEKMPLDAVLYQQLIGIWTDILKVSSVTAEDNFFTLGGTSMLALRMMMRVEKLCGRSLPLSILLTGATIANL